MLGLRAKLALVALALFALPWAGVLYVNEMERTLLAGQERALIGAARGVATALHDRPQLLDAAPVGDERLRREAERELQRLAGGEGQTLAREEQLREELASAEIGAILRGVQRTESRIWVVNRRYQVLALAGSLKRPASAEAEPGALVGLWRRLAGWLIERPTEDFADAVAEDTLAAGRELAQALQGAPGARTRRTADGRAVVIAAAHPIWSANEISGAVVVEETTNPIATLRSEALERLLALTLAVFAGVGALLFAFATRLSQRIRRLRDEAESAIDARGRITRLAAGSDAGDEIGDLSRSFSAMLGKLAQHHAYLESMAGRLSHELRTPIAVVRSSLENLKLASGAAESRTYIARAEEGLARLNTILQRMAEASRMEQSLQAAARERFDAGAVLQGCVEGYRLAYAPRAFELALPREPVFLEGAPDLLAQMLDKLVENAADFAAPGTAVRVALARERAQARLRVENDGPPLPEAVRDSLFDSMMSVRGARADGVPHLGLGLFVARLIAEFHGGALVAENLPGGRGVALEARLKAVV